MIEPHIKIIKRRVGDRAEVLYFMDSLKAYVTDVKIARTVHGIVKMFALSVGMVINAKKSAIQLSVETPLPDSLRDIHRLDETTYKFLGFEMKKGEVDRKLMMAKLKERVRDKLEEPMKRVEVSEAKNWIHFINQNAMSVIRFFAGSSSSPSGGLIGWTGPSAGTLPSKVC